MIVTTWKESRKRNGGRGGGQGDLVPRDLPLLSLVALLVDGQGGGEDCESSGFRGGGIGTGTGDVLP